jgi:hypothetical protein
MENSTQKVQLTVVEAGNLANNLIKNEGKTPDETIEYLINEGFKHEVAANIVNNALNKTTFKKVNDLDDESNGIKDMLFGALWFVGGSAVTILTYSNASGGGRYVVAYGAIIFGAFQFFRGLYDYSNK